MRPVGITISGVGSSLVWSALILSSVAWSIVPAEIGEVYPVSVDDSLSS